MRFSRPLKSSTHSLPSPNGAYIAIILPSKLVLRLTRSLEILRVIVLPVDLSSSIQWFLWSSSSERVLICTPDLIAVYSTTDQQFAARITNPTSGTAKITSISFGASDNDILVFSDFGLKLTIFNLTTSTSVEVSSPKFFSSSNSSKGVAYRPRTSSLALLTRSSGKDVVSIHTKDSYDVIRSWNPETVDAQGLSWSPDGRWLALVESSSQGHKILFYTPDGHLFKLWNGPTPTSDEDKDLKLGGGVRMLEWSSNSDHLAVGDYSSRATLLSAPNFINTLSLYHTPTIKSVAGMQIWQEHITPSPTGGFDRAFSLSTNTICPPTIGLSPLASDQNTKTGTNMLTFDNSGTLIASRSETMPTTIWIWDVVSKVLKVVMVLHAPIVKVTWNPVINELLMIRCEGDECRGLVHLWEPSWERPKILDFGTQLPEGKIIGRSIARWLNVAADTPAVFFSDSQDCILASLPESEDEPVPWQEAVARGVDIYGQREESPLNLVPADEKHVFGKGTFGGFVYDDPGMSVDEKYLLGKGGFTDGDPTMTGMSADDIDDTFRFKKFREP